MVSRNYPRLSIEELGGFLLETQDLDPIYTALHRLQMDPITLKRWCLAYWTFYDSGTACLLSEQERTDDFWNLFLTAALNQDPTPYGGRWPRGHERRHMRGGLAFDCYQGLKYQYRDEPQRFVDYCFSGPNHCRDIMKRVAQHKQFGPWIGFKISDMGERCLDFAVDFSSAEVFMFKDPTKAALMLWRLKTGHPEFAKPKDQAKVLEDVVGYLIHRFREQKAPPKFDRPFGLQEAETVLCKWKAHLNGHYPLNYDIDSIREGLSHWAPHSESAKRFLEALP